MREPRLRVYYGPQDEEVSTLSPATSKRETVNVRLGEVFPLLAEAVRGERTWLKDFEEDEVAISTDLYEVILAYQHYRRPTG